MKEIRMEVTSEQEAREYCEANNLEFVRVYEGRGINQGCLMALIYEYECDSKLSDLENFLKSQRQKVKIEDDGCDYIVGTPYNGGFLMLRKCNIDMNSSRRSRSANGVTFRYNEAAKFSKGEAWRRARIMSNHKGAYSWVARKVN